MLREDEIRIGHILDAADAVRRFVSGRSRKDLDKDQMLVFAIVRAIEIVGEAASRLGPEARDVFPVVPWAAIHRDEKSADPCLFRRGRGHSLAHGN